MKINKNFLENRLDAQLPAISEQRAELDRQERETIATILKDDQENKIPIGSSLEASCREAFEMDDIRQVESIDRLQTDSDEKNNDVPDNHITAQFITRDSLGIPIIEYALQWPIPVLKSEFEVRLHQQMIHPRAA
jgi:hypothetical protein